MRGTRRAVIGAGCRLAVAMATCLLALPTIGQERGLIIERAPAPGETEPVKPAWLYVVGIDEYQHDGVTDLRTAVRDAMAVRDLLVEKYQFDHEHLIERYDSSATRENILKDLRWLVQNLEEDDSLLIYYAGHGEEDTDLDRGYWLPTEADPPNDTTYIPNSEIHDYIEAIKAKHIWLISDSCFSGTLFERGTIPREIDERYYIERYRLPSRQVMTSGGIEPVSDGGRSDHSIFAYHFLTYLENATGSYVTPTEVGLHVGKTVANDTKSDQEPRTGPLSGSGDALGEFVLIARRSDPRPPQDESTVSINTGTDGDFRDQLATLAEAERTRHQRTEAAARKLQAQSESDWLALREVLLERNPESVAAARLYIERYRDASVTVDGETTPVNVEYVDDAQAWLDRQRTTRPADAQKLPWAPPSSGLEQPSEPEPTSSDDLPWESPSSSETSPQRSQRSGGVRFARVTDDLALRGRVIDEHRYRMVRIEAGEFMMGSPLDEANRQDDEVPHRVRLTRDFAIGKTEITQELYEAVMGENPSEFRGADHPVERVEWLDAVRFCNELSALEGLDPAYDISWNGDVEWDEDANGYRLPTEAEWEYAARGGEDYPFSGSADADDVAWYRDNSAEMTRDVGRLHANGYGLHDLSGNVYEWVWDYLWKYPTTLEIDPTGLEEGRGLRRARRGGAWTSKAKDCRVANRAHKDVADSNLGFRIARTIR